MLSEGKILSNPPIESRQSKRGGAGRLLLSLLTKPGPDNGEGLMFISLTYGKFREKIQGSPYLFFLFFEPF